MEAGRQPRPSLTMKRLRVCQVPLPSAKQTNLRRNSARAKTPAPSRDSVVPVSGTDGTVAPPLILTWRRSVKPKPLMADRLILSMRGRDGEAARSNVRSAPERSVLPKTHRVGQREIIGFRHFRRQGSPTIINAERVTNRRLSSVRSHP